MRGTAFPELACPLAQCCLWIPPLLPYTHSSKALEAQYHSLYLQRTVFWPQEETHLYQHKQEPKFYCRERMFSFGAHPPGSSIHVPGPTGSWDFLLTRFIWIDFSKLGSLHLDSTDLQARSVFVWGLSWALQTLSSTPVLCTPRAGVFLTTSHVNPGLTHCQVSHWGQNPHPHPRQLKPLLYECPGAPCGLAQRGAGPPQETVQGGTCDLWLPSAWKPLAGRPGCGCGWVLALGQDCGLKAGPAARSLSLRLTGHVCDSGMAHGDNTPSGAILKLKRPINVTH